jgi:hypothetical protein
VECKDFARYIGDYVNRTLGDELAGDAEMHLRACRECASLVRELEAASLMVRSLDRAAAPPGFEMRLRERLASQNTRVTSPARETFARRWLGALGRLFVGTTAHGHRSVLRPALAGLLLCVIVTGSLLMIGRDRLFDSSDMDWGYIEACEAQHASFASANPLADESAVILRERARQKPDL